MDKVILKIETTCNTSDKTLLSNLQATKERGFVPAPFLPDRKEKPLFICGSGPSLKRYYPRVKELWPNSDVMALNGAYKFLVEHMLAEPPQYYVQLDARPENVNFVDGILGNVTEFHLASQCAPEMFHALRHCPVRVFHLNTPTTHKVFPEADVYFGGGATVGSTAIALAASLGYRNIGLLGYDSSFEHGRSHVIPQSQNANPKTLDVWLGDKEYLTTAVMAKQVEDFRPWLQVLENTFPGLDIRLFGEGLLYDYIIQGQSGSVSRESEASKYTEMYKDPTYRMSDHRKETVERILSSRNKGRLLDVGAGRGETLKIAMDLGYEIASGVEVVDELINESLNIGYGMLPNVDAPKGYYDTVTCFEVIEHLLPADVVPALRNLAAIATDRVIVSVCTAPDMRGGVNLHPSFRTKQEWEETFKVAWGPLADVRCIGNVSKLDLSPVYEYCLRT